ncbi:hypothetical protein [Streptococcus salivarius]
MEKIELSEFFNEQYAKIDAYIDSISDQKVSYYNTIGLSLTIFTIFEYTINLMFNDFNEFILGEKDNVVKLQKLPLRAVSKIFSGENGSLKFKLGNINEFICLLQNSKREMHGKQEEISKAVREYYRFIHFNLQNTNGIERIDDMFFDGVFSVENEKKGSFFSEMRISITGETPKILQLDVENKQEKLAIEFIQEYSEKVRHVIAHKLPFESTETSFDDDYFEYRSELSPKKASKHFCQILTKLYEKYAEVHNHKIYIEDKKLLGESYKFLN